MGVGRRRRPPGDPDQLTHAWSRVEPSAVRLGGDYCPHNRSCAGCSPCRSREMRIMEKWSAPAEIQLVDVLCRKDNVTGLLLWRPRSPRAEADPLKGSTVSVRLRPGAPYYVPGQRLRLSKQSHLEHWSQDQQRLPPSIRVADFLARYRLMTLALADRESLFRHISPHGPLNPDMSVQRIRAALRMVRAGRGGS